jgi:hypothetical protein
MEQAAQSGGWRGSGAGASGRLGALLFECDGKSLTNDQEAGYPFRATGL